MGTIGRGISGLHSSALQSPAIRSSMKECLKSNKKRFDHLHTTNETNKNNSAGRNTQKFTAPFAPKCHDVENERLSSLEGRIRH